MTNKIGEKIKEFRLKSKITQKELADYLGVSFQSVSRWEKSLCYPDLEILPAIANFFDVSADELLGIDNLNKKERIDSINKQLQINFSKGFIDENITILRTAVNEFPNDFELLNNLAFYLSVNGMQKKQPEAAKESISIYERIWKDCSNNKIRYNLIQHLAYLYKSVGEKDKAIGLANELPVISKYELIVQLSDGDERIEHLLNEIRNNCETLTRNISAVGWTKYSDNDKIGVQNKIKLIQKAIKIYEIVYENGDFGFYNIRMREFYGNNAMNFLLLQDIENMFICLEKAAEYAITFDTLPEPYRHTSLLFEKSDYSQMHSVKDTTANESYQFLHDCLLDQRYDSVRENERFRAIVNKVEIFACK